MINLTGYKSDQELLAILACKEAKVLINVCNQEYTIESALCTSHEEGFINKEIVMDYTFKLVPISRMPLNIEEIEGVKTRISKLEQFMFEQKYGDGTIEKPRMF